MESKNINILFVCLGNICRSPAAEAIMDFMISNNPKLGHIRCDSAGTISTHQGEKPDPRMQKVLNDQGIFCKSKSRKINDQDFNDFDYILAMDNQNFKDISRLCPDDKYLSKIKKMTSYGKNIDWDFVPDPYYGADDGFKEVSELLVNCIENFIKKELIS